MAYKLNTTFGVTLIFSVLCSSCSSKNHDVPVFRKMSSEEIEKAVRGYYFDEGPFPCDTGPLALLRDGTFIEASGWGNRHGTYRIVDGKIVLKSRDPSKGGLVKEIGMFSSGNHQYHSGLYPHISDLILPLEMAPLDAKILAKIDANWPCGDDNILLAFSTAMSVWPLR